MSIFCLLTVVLSQHRRLLPAAAILLLVSGCAGTSLPDFQLADPELKVVPIDHVPAESLIAVRVDTSGRIFAGGREALFVYEPDARGGYQSPQELFRFPPESWIFDIAIRGHDLYLTTATALYVIPDGVIRRRGLEPRRLVWGQPRGHIQLGFHGLAWGPEGDLYFSKGDALPHYGNFTLPDHWGHWTLFSGPEATPTPYTGVGAVLRCQPDGGRLQVFSTGTFNSFGLAFDRRWNLFSNDNDREAMPQRYVPARLLHVAPKSYFGWPRGWLPGKTPYRADLLETMYEGLGREAPVGQAYYDDPFLPIRYRDNLLLARWAQRAVSRHPLQVRGASFQSGEEAFLVGKNLSRPVGVAVGRGGRIFATVGHMARLESSPVYDADLVMITRADDVPAHPFEAYDAPTASPERLWAELSNLSWQRRYDAHVEILRRGGALLEEATRRLAALDPGDPAGFHLPWLAAASGKPEAANLLLQLARHPEAAVRVQAVRALAEFPQLGASRDVFLHALEDSHPQVQHAAVIAFFNLPGPLPRAIVEGPATSQDTYLRQAATLLLAERSSLPFLSKLSQAGDAPTRLAAVLAAGFRLTLPRFTEPIPPDLPLDPFPESETIIQFADSQIDLRTLGRIGKFTTAEHWKAGRPTDEQERLFALLLKTLRDEDELVRQQAAHFLLLLDDQRSEPLVARVIEEGDQARLEGAPLSFVKGVTAAWILGPLDDGPAGFGAEHSVEQGPVDLTAVYRQGRRELSWRKISAAQGYFDFSEATGARENASYYVHFVLESGTMQSVMFFVGSSDGVKVWHNGTQVWENEIERRALAYNDMVMLRLQQGSNHILVRVHNRSGDSALYVHHKALEPVAAVAPERADMSLLAERLRNADAHSPRTLVPEAFRGVNWERTVARGDSQRGRELFEQLACNRCHSLSSDGTGTIGPSLAEAGRRFSVPHLVEAILLPNQQISPVFRQTLIVTESEHVAGLVMGETAEKIDLVLSDTSRRTILKEEIIERRLLELSLMPEDLVTTPEELQDLLAYLLSHE